MVAPAALKAPHTLPPKLSPGDRVAIVSPSFAAPAVFPAIHELAMHRLRSELGLEPVEYPTTRKLGASPAERAADLMAAWRDPEIKGVLATIGGDDQMTVLPHLDPAVVVENPKAYFGYSDNTNLLNWLWFHGIAGYHGGSTMVHLGRSGHTHPVTLASWRHALFERGDAEVRPSERFNEDDVRWDSDAWPESEPTSVPSPGWSWRQADRTVRAPTWGGNLEVLQWSLAVDRFIRPVEDYAGCILLIETSEETPSATEVFRTLRNLGERGLLRQFPAVIVGLARASGVEGTPLPPPEVVAEARTAYRSAQRDAVVRAFSTYNPDAMIVFDVDIGHTDPQYVIPYGGEVTVDGPARRIVVHGSPRDAAGRPNAR